MNELSRFEFLKFYFDLYRYNGRAITLAKNFVQTRVAFRQNNGYEAALPAPRDSINTIYSANKIQEGEHEPFYFEQPDLREFISICQHENILLICFTSPLYKVTHRNLQASKAIDSLLSINHIPYLNFLNKPIKELKGHPSFWKDSHHINHTGALVESRLVAEEVEKIMQSRN